jgi:hypothetical protein
MRMIAAVAFVLIAAPAVSNGCGPGDCNSDSDCSSGQSCLFPMGNCSARGECRSLDESNGCTHTPTCNALESLCGCDGTMVTTGCGFPQGWATGPTPATQNDACFVRPATNDAGTMDAESDALGE